MLPPDKMMVAYRIWCDHETGEYVLQFDMGDVVRTKRFDTEAEAEATVEDFMRTFNGKVVGRG